MIGGIYEIIFGFLLIFAIVPLLNLLGAGISELKYPTFNQTAGLLAIIIGLILALSSFNIENYLINIILIIILRFTIQIIIFINIFNLPEIASGLLVFGIIDLIFAIITIYLMKVLEYSFNTLKLIK